jgi:hypothetical protein
MTSINAVSRDYTATRHFADDAGSVGAERRFLDMDAIVHATIDQTDLGNDNTSIYGVALPVPAYERHRSTANAGSGAGFKADGPPS